MAATSRTVQTNRRSAGRRARWSAGVVDRERRDRRRHALMTLAFCASALVAGLAGGAIFMKWGLPALPSSLFTHLHSIMVSIQHFLDKLIP
jgi:fatty acid desaturase